MQLTLVQTQNSIMRKPEFIPNYYAYELAVNGRRLSSAKKTYFFSCINKIYQENEKFIYRGDKKDKLQSLYGVSDDYNELGHSLFIMGAKAGMFVGSGLPGINEIDIAEAGNNEFRLIFRMLRNLLRREFPFGSVRIAMKQFREVREQEVTAFFQDNGNEQVFIDKIEIANKQQQILIRDYYLALLHHISKSEYYASSFLLSTTSSFSQAHRFAWKEEPGDSANPIIFFGWIPKHYEGVLSVPDSRVLRRKVNMGKLRLPIYERSFFPNQEEITLKGGLLPHYLLGYLHIHQGKEVFEINPALFATDESWDGIELPIDQSSFHERIENTLFGRYFTFDDENGRYNQHAM